MPEHAEDSIYALKNGAVLIANDLDQDLISSLLHGSKTIATTSSGYLADYYTDGVSDDVQIQLAISAVEANGGGTVFLRKGSYSISSSIVISLSKGVNLIGEGWSTVLTAVNSLNDNVIEFNPPSSGVWAKIADFKIDGNGANQTSGNCIYAFGALQCLFDHLWITSPWGNAIHLYQDGNGGTGHHSRITNCLFDQGENSNGGDGRAIRIEANDEVMVMNCDFESNGRSAASEPNHIFDRAGLNHFIGNVFVGGQTGIKIEGSRSRVVGCMFDGCKNHAIRLNGNENVILGNSIFQPGYGSGTAIYDGVWIDNVTHNTVSNNIFITDNTGTRSGINFANGATNNLATQNIFNEQGSGYGTAPIILGTGNKALNNGGVITEVQEADYQRAKNTSGGQLVAGDVVTFKAVAAGNELTTTTTQGDDLVYGIASATIENNAFGLFQTGGKTTSLKVDGTTDIAIGDFLGTFTTAKIGMKAAAGDMAFAIALEAYITNDSSGVLDALLVKPRKI